MRWQIAILILILVALGAFQHGVRTTDKPADVRLRHSQSARQSDGGSLDVAERSLRELLQRSRQEDSRDGQSGRSKGKERIDDLVETTSLRMDTLVARERNEKTATVSATATPVPATESVEAQPFGEIERLICAKEWPCDIAICIAESESGLDPTAYNPDSGTTGIFQLRPSAQWERVTEMGYQWSDLYRADVNIEVAYAIYLDWHGFGAYDGSPQCWN